MPKSTGWALAIAAGCSFIVGLGIVSCSDDTPSEDIDEQTAALPPPSNTGPADAQERVTPPADFRRVEAPTCAVGNACRLEFGLPFFINEIGQTDTHFYVALKHQGEPPASSEIPTGALDVGVRVDGCRVGSIAARGVVRQTANDVSWIELPLSELPEGELEVTLYGTVGSTSVGASISLLRSGTSVSYLTMSKRQGYRERAVTDPRTGRSYRLALHKVRDLECAQ